MKYFTKYLPVEGEITNHFVDLKYGEQGKIYTREGGIGNTIMSFFHSHSLEDCKAVKLFLCSRDIQVGDEIKSLIADGSTKATEDHVYKQTLYAKNQSYFKVIGEISPDALSYVKKGQEFDEEQLKFWKDLKLGLKHQGGFVVDPTIRPDWQEWVTDVQVKGPCGHFH